MKAESIGYLRCPACRSELQLVVEERRESEIFAGRLLCQVCQQDYEIKSGLPNLVHPEPEKLSEIDAKFLEQYERIAASYDHTARLLSLLLGICPLYEVSPDWCVLGASPAHDTSFSVSRSRDSSSLRFASSMTWSYCESFSVFSHVIPSFPNRSEKL